jgi:DNA-binding NtrC family response regulator
MASVGLHTLSSLESLPPDDPESLILGRDAAVTQVAHHAQRAAQVECTVLITGETGTGKEVWARLLQRLGPRRDQPFIPVNCAALTPTLAESQLFGHEAFSGPPIRGLSSSTKLATCRWNCSRSSCAFCRKAR